MQRYEVQQVPNLHPLTSEDVVVKMRWQVLMMQGKGSLMQSMDKAEG